MIKKEFVKSSIIYTFSSALSTIASFVLLPFYTNVKLLAVSDYGALSLYIGLSLFVQVIASLSVDFYVGVVYHELKHDPLALRKKIASLNGYMIFAGVAIMVFLIGGGNFFIQKYVENPPPEAFRYVIMASLTGIFSAHFRFYSNLLIHREKPLRYFLVNLLNFVTTILFSVWILETHPMTLEGPMWGRLLSCACIFMVSFFEITYAYGIEFKSEYIKSSWQFCFPLILTAVFQWVLSYSDRYIIKPLLHNKEVAVFDLAVRCTLLISFFSDGLVSALAPRIYSMLKENSEENINEISKYYSSFNIILILAIGLNILVIPILLSLFISSDQYFSAFLYAGIICAGFVTRSIQNLFIYPIYFFKKTSRFIPINGISAVAQVVLGYFMVKAFKLYGAAFTLNFVKVIQIALYFYFCRDLLFKKINVNKMILLPVFAMLVFWVPELFINQYAWYMHTIHLLEFAVVIAATYLVYRKEINELVAWLLNRLKLAG